MHFQGEILKLARINKKAAAIIAAIVVAGSCTSAAVFQIHRNNSQDNLDSSAVQTEKKQFTPEDMASYIQDSNSLIAEDTQKQIQLYNANWKMHTIKLLLLQSQPKILRSLWRKGYVHKWI